MKKYYTKDSGWGHTGGKVYWQFLIMNFDRDDTKCCHLGSLVNI